MSALAMFCRTTSRLLPAWRLPLSLSDVTTLGKQTVWPPWFRRPLPCLLVFPARVLCSFLRSVGKHKELLIYAFHVYLSPFTTGKHFGDPLYPPAFRAAPGSQNEWNTSLCNWLICGVWMAWYMFPPNTGGLAHRKVVDFIQLNIYWAPTWWRHWRNKDKWGSHCPQECSNVTIM